MRIEQLQSTILQAIGSAKGRFSVVVHIGEEAIDINGSERVTAASLIKVPILLTACKMSDQGRLDIKKVVSIPPHEKVGGTGVVSRLSDGLALPLEDLLTLMMIVSDNTATNLCIDEVGISNITEFLRTLACNQTILGRRLMDFEARKAGRDNFISARDMVRMLQALCEENILQEVSSAWAMYVLKSQQFNHKLPRLIPSGIPGDAFIAHKTGELPGVEHDAGIMERGDKRAYVAVLSRNLISNIEGQRVIGEIGKAVWEYLGDE